MDTRLTCRGQWRCDNLGSWSRPAHTPVSPLLQSHVCCGEREHGQRRLELHPCSPVAQRRLCVKQKLVPLVRQNLTRTGNLYLQNLKINFYPVRIVLFGLSDHLLRVVTHTRICYIGKYFLTCSINPQPPGTSPVPKPMQLHLVKKQALPWGATTVNWLSSNSKIFSELDFLLLWNA